MAGSRRAGKVCVLPVKVRRRGRHVPQPPVPRPAGPPPDDVAVRMFLAALTAWDPSTETRVTGA